MAITTELLQKRYACNGANQTFPIPFEYLSTEAFVVVHLYDSSMATYSTLTLDIDYTISNSTVTTVSIYSAEFDLMLLLDPTLTQTTEWIENDKFTSDSWENALDKLTVISKTLQEQVDRCIKGPPVDADGLTWGLPGWIDRADGYLHFNASTGAVEVVASEISNSAITGFAATLLDDTSAAAALSTLGVTAFVQTLFDDTSASAFLSTQGVSAFAQTLLDDTTAAAARTTLGVDPPGIISAYGGTSAPTGWLACDGAAVSRTTYAALFAAISTTWGIGDGSSTFNLPDLRGIGLRGSGTNATRQDAVGSYYIGGSVGDALADQMQGHYHQIKQAVGGAVLVVQTTATGAAGASTVTNSLPALTDGTNGTPRTGAETRMATSSVLFIIKV